MEGGRGGAVLSSPGRAGAVIEKPKSFFTGAIDVSVVAAVFFFRAGINVAQTGEQGQKSNDSGGERR